MKMASCSSVVKSGLSSIFFEYSTPKIVHIRSKSIGIFNKLVQLSVIGYIIGYVLIYKGGYQLEDVGVSGTTTKVKGVTYTDVVDPRVGTRVWDASDIVIPAEENNAFFITTNVIVTGNQTQGVCPEAETVYEAQCHNDTDCLPVGKAYLLGHGVTTGQCNLATNSCFVKAWCPLEKDSLATSYAVLNGTKDFTVLIKSHVFFPYYKKTRSNIIESTNKTYLQGCLYDAGPNAFCPIFKLDYIVREAQRNSDASGDYDSLAIEGGVVSIRISWNCNFDHDETRCKPEYSFDRLDDDHDSLIARGYNFRYSNNFVDNGRATRQQIKAYGILFIITVDAKARKFNALPTFQNIGSGIALLAIATVLCDLFALFLHPQKQLFESHKYEQVRTDDAFTISQSYSDLRA